jgi:hypothetical protein
VRVLRAFRGCVFLLRVTLSLLRVYGLGFRSRMHTRMESLHLIFILVAHFFDFKHVLMQILRNVRWTCILAMQH